MMHHPSMHHQPMSGHPPQHLQGHQGMPGHHQMPPHQMHRENRHVTLTRLPLGASQGNGGMGAHGPGALLPPHHAPPRPAHPIRPMSHHPPSHHSVPPPPIKTMRRPYSMGGAYPGGGPAPGPGAQCGPSAQCGPRPQARRAPPRAPPPLAPPAPLAAHHAVPPPPTGPPLPSQASGAGEAPDAAEGEAGECGAGAGGDARLLPPSPANSKEKTPMCLVNELARYNKIKHQYRLTSETGPPHKKVFTVTLRLGETEEYTAEGSSIKRAQHAAAAAALAGTRCPPPPPRAAPPHAPAVAHHRHNGVVMPTVELNALAMKLCQPAVYTMIPPTTTGRAIRPRAPNAPPGPPVPPGPPRPPFCLPPPHQPYAPNVPSGSGCVVYRVRVGVGGRAWLGAGATPQAARHDAAARALHDLRRRSPTDPAPTSTPASSEESEEAMTPEVKSPVSLVHELALKRNLSVQFTVKSERGPPHMRVFITACTVGDMETEGEGNGKKVSKRRAAEVMLEEIKTRWPPALLKAKPTQEKRRQQATKKKPRNLIKEAGAEAGAAETGADNPISRLAVARQAARARSPQYRVLEERGAARRREFLVHCDAPPHQAVGHGPSKKTAKRRAAINVLLAMEQTSSGEAGGVAAASDVTSNGAGDSAADAKRKEGEPTTPPGSEVRQPVPGVLLMDYNNRAPQNNQTNGVDVMSGGVSEAGEARAGSPAPGVASKDKLLYLADLLGFTVQFSDFPKRNHGEYLSLVSLSTSPPVMCHGGGASTRASHEHCARAALRALALMGLDQVQTSPNSGSKTGSIGNGIAE